MENTYSFGDRQEMFKTKKKKGDRGEVEILQNDIQRGKLQTAPEPFALFTQLATEGRSVFKF